MTSWSRLVCVQVAREGGYDVVQLSSESPDIEILGGPPLPPGAMISYFSQNSSTAINPTDKVWRYGRMDKVWRGGRMDKVWRCGRMDKVWRCGRTDKVRR